MAAMKMVWRRPNRWLMGSEIHAQLYHELVSENWGLRDKTYKRAMAM